MKLIYRGKFNGDPESLPHGEHRPGAVRFREAENPEELIRTLSVTGIVLPVGLLLLYFLRFGGFRFSLAGIALAFLTLLPHEFLHAVCFRNEVYLYTNLKQGMLFVTGPENMSRARFVFMSLLPNVVFGAIPYAMAMVRPELAWAGYLGALAIGFGVGDYYNVKNALTQMPKGARTYLYGFHSYWYLPAADETSARRP